MKRFIFTLAAIVLTVLLIELFLGYLLRAKKSDVLSSTYHVISRVYFRLYPITIAGKAIETTFSPQLLLVPDEDLGWSNRPGTSTVTFKEKATGIYHRFRAMIDENGNRITSFNPELFEGKKEIWVFGDSFVFGMGNNDETTFPFFLQQFLPDFRIVNYGGRGYGNLQGYLQIKRELEKKKAQPEIMVIVYGDYFPDRNIAAPSRIKGIRDHHRDHFVSDPSIQLALYRHPRASIDNGELKVDYVQLFSESDNASEEEDPGLDYQYEVTKKILSEIYSIGEENGVKMILAFLRGDDSDEAVAYARELGYLISDLRPGYERNEWDNFGIFDDHPGPLAQNNYAIKLHKTISELMEEIAAF